MQSLSPVVERALRRLEPDNRNEIAVVPYQMKPIKTATTEQVAEYLTARDNVNLATRQFEAASQRVASLAAEWAEAKNEREDAMTILSEKTKAFGRVVSNMPPLPAGTSFPGDPVADVMAMTLPYRNLPSQAELYANKVTEDD